MNYCLVYKNKYSVVKILFITLILFYVLGCSAGKSENEFLIKVNENVITKGEFFRQFNLYPLYKNNSNYKSALLQQADKLTEQLYYLEASRLEKFDTLQHIRDHYQFIHNSEMLKQLYKKNVLDQINVSDEQAWEEYKKQNISLSIRHLFAKGKTEVDYIYKSLKNGNDFHTLAPKVFTDSALAANGGYLGFIRLTDFDPLLIDSIYNLKIGEISKPLLSSFGYHIFKIEDVKQSVFLDKNYFDQNIDELKKNLRNRQSAKESALYVKKILKGKSLNIKGNILNEVSRIIENEVTEKNSQNLMLYPNVTDIEIIKIKRNLNQIADSILVQFSDDSWTVDEFIAMIKVMPPLQRPDITGRNKIQKVIIDKVRDKYLLEESYRTGLDKSGEVRKNVDAFYKEVLANEFEKSILYSAEKNRDANNWNRRKDLLSGLKTKYPALIDTSMLLSNLSSEVLEKKTPLIKFVVREQYKW
ncbi:MAG: peptidylprolyl isomerase [Melioribacteraceae bacterium]|nr:peptidylprolyl isomerase [Melioribacteraceae bacterium]